MSNIDDDFDFGFNDDDTGDNFGSFDDSTFDSGGQNNSSSNFDDFSNFDVGNTNPTQNSARPVINSNQQQDLNDFSGQFDDDNIEDAKKSVGKTAIIAIIVGIVIIAAVFIIIGIVKKNGGGNKQNPSQVEVIDKNDVNNNTQNNNNTQDNSNTQNNNQTNNTQDNNTNQNANNTTGNQQVVITNPNNISKDNWIEIGASEQEKIKFNNEYSTLQFTITSVTHKAKYSGNTLVVKTVVSGSLSGLNGTYEIELPFNIGSSLSIGNILNVEVLLGSYNDKIVVGEIKF